MVEVKTLGTWWNDRGIEVVGIEGRAIALHGWNGEHYQDCFEVADCRGGKYFEMITDGLSVEPEYIENDGDFETVGYHFV